MKLKTWLLITYFIVMILPLGVAYILFAWIQSYNNEQKVVEFFHASSEIQAVTTILREAELYNPKVNHKKVEQLNKENVFVDLYQRDGFLIYSSNPVVSNQVPLNKEDLYADLYSIKQGYQTFSYKEPVFADNQIVGFFQVHVPRSEWMDAVTERSAIMSVIFILIFLAIYVVVIFFVNKKVNQRLTALMVEMTSFAEGKPVVETPVNKDEIGQLKKHFYEMRKQILSAREEIEKEQQTKEYMIATISHDLKTPLTSIRAYAESLATERGLSESEQKEYREVIVEKANFMKHMLDDLLTYTLLRSPSYEMERVNVDGIEFFEMLLSGYEPLCSEKSITLQTTCDVQGMYEVNPKQMIRVVDNLMSNAIQHTQAGQKIWLAAFTPIRAIPLSLFDFVYQQFEFEQEFTYLIVQNEGKDISQEELQHVFDPLYQVDQARSKKDARGTGLGLSITKQIIEKHEGDVYVLSEENKGTCVICRLPKIKI